MPDKLFFGEKEAYRQVMPAVGGRNSTFYVAQGQSTNATVGIKTPGKPSEHYLFCGYVLSPRQIAEIYEKEAAILGLLNSKAVVSFVDVNVQSPNDFFIATEYMDGGNLDMLEGRISKPNAKILEVRLQEALREIHKEGIIHRDVNPSNILATKEAKKALYGNLSYNISGYINVIKLADFGIAMVLACSSPPVCLKKWELKMNFDQPPKYSGKFELSTCGTPGFSSFGKFDGDFSALENTMRYLTTPTP